MQNNTDGNKNRKLHARRVKRRRLGTVPALQYSLLPRNNKGSLKIVYKDSRQPEKRKRVLSLSTAFLKHLYSCTILPPLRMTCGLVGKCAAFWERGRRFDTR